MTATEQRPTTSDLLPFLRVGDRLTAVINMGASIKGTFADLEIIRRPEVAPGLFVRVAFTQWMMIYNDEADRSMVPGPIFGATPAPPLEAILSAPEAEARYVAAVALTRAAELLAIASGMSADESTKVVQAALDQFQLTESADGRPRWVVQTQKCSAAEALDRLPGLPAVAACERAGEPNHGALVRDASQEEWKRGVRGLWRRVHDGAVAASWVDLWHISGPLLLINPGTGSGRP